MSSREPVFVVEPDVSDVTLPNFEYRTHTEFKSTRDSKSIKL